MSIFPYSISDRFFYSVIISVTMNTTPVIKTEENQDSGEVELRIKKADSKKSAKAVEERACPLVRKKKMAVDANGVPIAKIRWYCPPKQIWKPTLEVNKMQHS